MSDLDDETDTSCGEEQIVSDWKVRKEWLESILSKSYGGRAVKVREFDIHPECATSKSVLSAITRVNVKYLAAIMSDRPNDKCRQCFIIKQLPKDPFSRFFVTEGQFDLREIKFYTQVVPDLKEFNKRAKTQERIILPVPKCYDAHYSPAGGTDDSPVPPESRLTLEDLSNSGYMSVEFSEGLRLNQVMAALNAIACIHAHSLSMKVVDGQSLSERYPFLFQTAKATDSYQQLVERGLPQLAHFLKSKPGLKAVLETLLVLRPRTKDIISALLAPEGPLALITHTDFWSNNLLFKTSYSSYETTTNCYILDWQMVTYSRPTNDIALLLVSSVPTELRREYTETFLDTYWQKLNWTCSHLGLDIPKDLGYTREDLSKDYRKSQLLALLLCIGSVDVALGNPLTEQRLIDVLKDLYNDGILTDEAIVATNEADS